MAIVLAEGAGRGNPKKMTMFMNPKRCSRRRHQVVRCGITSVYFILTLSSRLPSALSVLLNLIRISNPPQLKVVILILKAFRDERLWPWFMCY
uniref:Uncharacterized protein n=1 Tax=Medicago truncatula TaxID=3880 RepID=Q2HRK2_MEDTR|nr:hypothetical protein MtrDRAFT_AC158501g8v2 [Medicago truncatula]